MDTIVAAFRGYIKCFDNVKEGGIIYGCGAMAKGSINGHHSMEEAYEMGKNI